MSTTSTVNYSLVKPTPGTAEPAAVAVINGNMDVIDTTVKSVSDAAVAAQSSANTANNALPTLRKVIGGIIRTTADGNTSSTTEKVCITGPSLALEDSKMYEVTLHVIYGGNTGSDLFQFRIREDSLTGNSLVAVGGTSVVTTGGSTLETIKAHYTTGVGPGSKVFVGTIQRLVGTGVANARIGTFLTVERIGASGLLTTV